MCSAEDEDIELEWEEWDGKSPYLHHCIAGSIAGVAEHTLLYPVDTVKTHMQSYCADCPLPAAAQRQQLHDRSAAANPTSLGLRASAGAAGGGGGASASARRGMWGTVRDLVGRGHSGLPPHHPSPPRPGRPHASLASAGAVVAVEETAASAAAAAAPRARGGILRLWRGVQTVAVGCVPAHALYFSSYEAVKGLFLEREAGGEAGGGAAQPQRQSRNLGPIGSSAAGAAAALSHDVIMTPLDTVKQRLQLGHYDGMGHGLRRILADEGFAGLYRSFPVTLLTNIPYGAVMVATNEFLRESLKPDDPGAHLDLRTTILAGCGAGAAAAAVTTPLDRVKTRLQTQRLGTAIAIQAASSSSSSSYAPSCDGVPLTGGCPKARAEAALLRGELAPRYADPGEAARSILREEGWGGLFRGAVPRLVTHAPAVAISWTAYETAKRWLGDNLP